MQYESISERKEFDSYIGALYCVIPYISKDNFYELLKCVHFQKLCFDKLHLPLACFNVVIAWARHQNIEAVKSVEGHIHEYTTAGRRTTYGGTPGYFVDSVLKVRVQDDGKFVDAGSGIGHICMQLSATTGVISTGFEIIKNRHDVGLKLLTSFDEC